MRRAGLSGMFAFALPRALAVAFVATLALSALLVSPAAAMSPGERLDRYVSIWQSNDRVTRDTVREFYADRVIYYGKRMTRDEVYRDKLRFIRAWPIRTYDIAPGSFRSRCDRSGVCRARAVLRWTRAKPDGRSKSGASRLTLVFAKSEGGRIIRESATNIRR